MKITTLSLSCARIIEGILRKLREFGVRPQPGPLAIKTNAGGESYQEARNPVLTVLKSSFMHDTQYNFDWMLEAARKLEGMRISALFPEFTTHDAIFILKVHSHAHEFITVQLDNECIAFVQALHKNDILKKIGVVSALGMRCKYSPGIGNYLLQLNGKPKEFDLEKLCNELNVPATTRRTHAFFNTVLKPVQDDLLNTPLCFGYAPGKKVKKKVQSILLFLQTPAQMQLEPYIGAGGELLQSKYGLNDAQVAQAMRMKPEQVIEKVQYINEAVRTGKVRQVHGAKVKPVGGVSVITDFERVSGGYSAKVFFGGG